MESSISGVESRYTYNEVIRGTSSHDGLKFIGKMPYMA